MRSLIRKIESINNRYPGCVRKTLSYLELIFLIASIPITFFFSNLILGLDLKIFIPEYSIFGLTILVSWYIKEQINSQAKLPRTQRKLYLIFHNSQTYFIISLLVILFKFIFQLESIPVLFILLFLSFFFCVTIFFKLVGYSFLKIYRSNGYNLHHILIIVDGLSDEIIERLLNQKEWGFVIRGIVTNSKLIRKKYGDKIAILPEDADLMPIITKKVIDEIIYSKYIVVEEQVRILIQQCNEVGIIFRLQSGVSPIEPHNLDFKTLNESKFLTLVDLPSNHFGLLLKTISDYYLAIFAMIVLSPVFFLIALLIKLDSKGPVFFKQERIGLHGRKFMLYKFRTMVVDAEKKLSELQAKNESDGPVFKIRNDPRITRIGKFLRKTSLDELPQLQNVIKGQMALIGPRPPLESEVKQYQPWQLRRLSVKPGITCTWQVVPNRNDVKFDSWMKMDLNYIDNWTLTKDLQLMIKTIKVLFFAEGR